MTEEKKKMIEIYEIITKSKGYMELTITELKCKNGDVGYYVNNKEYFNIKYDGYEVNIRGYIEYPNIDCVIHFNFNEWLDKVLKLLKMEDK